jgi:hypothetical protein
MVGVRVEAFLGAGRSWGVKEGRRVHSWAFERGLRVWLVEG